MNDTRNALLAWASSITSLFAAVDTRDVLTIITAVVLPVVFFTLGKTVDVLVQIYVLKRRVRSSCFSRPDAVTKPPKGGTPN